MKWLLLLMAATTLNAAPILRTDDFSEVLARVEDDTLVIVDIENTLIRPGHYLGSTPWGWSYVDRLQSDGYMRDEAMEETRRIMKKVVQVSSYVPVQPEIPAILLQLQEWGCEVMGVSNRPPEWGFATSDALMRNGIFLQEMAPVKGTFVMPGRSDLEYIEGILFVRDMGNKGLAMGDFLQAIGRRPGRVLVVDDRRSNVEAICNELELQEIDCVGFFYTGASKWRRGYDADIAAIQLKHFGKILSNADAERLLREGVAQ